ncbi:MAG: HD domain-containing phosphohydrolase [Candidatus Omnitrophota bacterium]|nr:HD domain-containing phosphohydrolase [Candidatus Omnitrophota bacterium]
MKKYKAIFSSFHTIYRLIATSTDITNFASGISRLYKNTFKADRVILIFKNVNSHGFMKIRLEEKKHYIKKGGISILNRKEKEIIKREKEVLRDDVLVYPFIFSDTLGVVYIKRSLSAPRFNELEKKWFLSLSEEVSVSLKIFSLYREQKRLMINYINSLTKLLDQYVPTSYLHVKSIFRLIKVIGRELKLSEAEIKSLEYASLLHDAGKIQLPSGILKKETPLTDEEFKMVMKHPRKGVEMIKDLDVLKPVIPIILHHHERFDGQGYPSRFRKDQIPIGSRILSVLDAFDAMFFGRPYKKRRQLKEIERELMQQVGKQFDPKIVEVFLKILRRKNIKKYLRSFL